MSQCDWWAPHDGGMVFCVGDSGHRGKHTSTLGSFTEWRPRTTRVMELTAEVARLREALEAVTKACICGGTGRRMYWPECPMCEADEDEHACSPQREGVCANPACSIARAALAAGKREGG